MAATKAQLQEQANQLIGLVDELKETIEIQAKTIVHQHGELTNAATQITQICEGMSAIADSNAQTKSMVEEVKDSMSRDWPIVPGFWN
jgi:hypothetical protein